MERINTADGTEILVGDGISPSNQFEQQVASARIPCIESVDPWPELNGAITESRGWLACE
jgi:hypothetical protein